MSRPALEVADIFRDHGGAWRHANRGHVSLLQLKVMSAIESCRTAALGGHVARCEDCAHTTIAYNSCRNRHCPKCQAAAARDVPAENRGAAALDGAHHLHLGKAHVAAVGLTPIGAVVAEDVRDLQSRPSHECLAMPAASPSVASAAQAGRAGW